MVLTGVYPRKVGTSIKFGDSKQRVFASVAEAMAETGADVSVLFVPLALTKDAIIERAMPESGSPSSSPKVFPSAIPRSPRRTPSRPATPGPVGRTGSSGDGVETGRHAATITGGLIGVLHGARTYVLQDEDGQIVESHSISACLDLPGSPARTLPPGRPFRCALRSPLRCGH